VSRDVINHVTIGGLLTPSHYLTWLPRYWASDILG